MAKGKKTSLKTVLSSQQSRLKKKQEAALAAQAAEKSKKGPQPKGKGKAIAQRSTIPFKPTDRILCIGEGNFSFTRALVCYPPSSLEFMPPSNVTATAYDSEDGCYAKYPDAAEIVAELRDKGVEVVFGVDATKLEKCSPLKGRKWDRIVWNFPHAGELIIDTEVYARASFDRHRHIGKGLTDQDRNILSNQILILGFLRSAANFLTDGPIPAVMPSRKRKRNEDEEDDPKSDAEREHADVTIACDVQTRGTILITLRNVTPYILW